MVLIAQKIRQALKSTCLNLSSLTTVLHNVLLTYLGIIAVVLEVKCVLTSRYIILINLCVVYINIYFSKNKVYNRKIYIIIFQLM